MTESGSRGIGTKSRCLSHSSGLPRLVGHPRRPRPRSRPHGVRCLPPLAEGRSERHTTGTRLVQRLPQGLGMDTKTPPSSPYGAGRTSLSCVRRFSPWLRAMLSMRRLAASLRPPALVSPTRSWCRCAAPPRECRACTLTCLLVVCAALLRVHSRRWQSLLLPRLRSVRRLRSTWYDQSRASCPCTPRSPTGARGGAPCCASTRATSRRCGRRGPGLGQPGIRTLVLFAHSCYECANAGLS